MFAIIETGGKQYKVNEGDIIFVEKLEKNEGETVVFDCVKAISAGEKLEIGAPTVAGAKGMIPNTWSPWAWVVKMARIWSGCFPARSTTSVRGAPASIKYKAPFTSTMVQEQCRSAQGAPWLVPRKVIFIRNLRFLI